MKTKNSRKIFPAVSLGRKTFVALLLMNTLLIFSTVYLAQAQVSDFDIGSVDIGTEDMGTEDMGTGVDTYGVGPDIADMGFLPERDIYGKGLEFTSNINNINLGIAPEANFVDVDTPSATVTLIHPSLNVGPQGFVGSGIDVNEGLLADKSADFVTPEIKGFNFDNGGPGSIIQPKTDDIQSINNNGLNDDNETAITRMIMNSPDSGPYFVTKPPNLEEFNKIMTDVPPGEFKKVATEFDTSELGPNSIIQPIEPKGGGAWILIGPPVVIEEQHFEEQYIEPVPVTPDTKEFNLDKLGPETIIQPIDTKSGGIEGELSNPHKEIELNSGDVIMLNEQMMRITEGGGLERVPSTYVPPNAGADNIQIINNDQGLTEKIMYEGKDYTPDDFLKSHPDLIGPQVGTDKIQTIENSNGLTEKILYQGNEYTPDGFLKEHPGLIGAQPATTDKIKLIDPLKELENMYKNPQFDDVEIGLGIRNRDDDQIQPSKNTQMAFLPFTLIRPDGVKTTTLPDGITVNEHPDGRQIIEYNPDTVKRTETYQDGSQKLIFPSGITITINPSGKTDGLQFPPDADRWK